MSARLQPPAHDPPPWTRPRPRDLRPPPHVLAPFEPHVPLAHLPLLTSTLNRTLSPSLSLCARDQRAPPPPSVDCRPFCDRRRARAPSVASVSSALPSATRDTLWLPFSSLVCPVHAHRSVSCAVGAPPPSARGSIAPRRSPSIPGFALEVSTLPMPLFSQVSPQSPRNCSPELVAPPQDFSHRGLCSLAPPCRFCVHCRVRRVTLNMPDPFPKPLEPHRGHPPRLR
jgi:hypothetical protein